MKRYEAYKDSGVKWLGEIPVTWTCGRIRSVYALRKELVEDGEPDELVSVSEYYGVDYRRNRISSSDVLVRADSLEGYQLCYPDDLVMNIMLAWKGAQGTSAIKGLVSPSYGVFRPLEGSCPRYYHYLMRTDQYKEYFKSYSSGIIDSRLRLYPEVFLHLNCHVPPLEEQRAIADYLDAKTAEIDTLVADCEREVELLREYRKSLITEVMTKGLNPAVPMYDSGIESVGMVPEGWRVYKLRWLCSFHNGDRGTNYPSASDFQDNGIAFYGADALVGDIVDREQARFITRERYDSMGGLKIQAFDTLYTLRGSTIGKNAIAIDPEGTVASSLMGIRVRSLQDIDPWYLHYWLNSYQEYQQRDACINGSTAPNLSAEDVAQYRIALPPRELQDEMVKAIRARSVYADSLISDKQHMADKLREYRRSLISEAVTGKFKVPGV